MLVLRRAVRTGSCRRAGHFATDRHARLATGKGLATPAAAAVSVSRRT
jgi:hypothetical protein